MNLFFLVTSYETLCYRIEPEEVEDEHRKQSDENRGEFEEYRRWGEELPAKQKMEMMTAHWRMLKGILAASALSPPIPPLSPTELSSRNTVLRFFFLYLY